MDLYTAFQVSFWADVFFIIVIGVMYWRAGEYITASIVGWWKKTGIAMELVKTGGYRFYAAPIPKEYPQIIEKPNDAGIIEIRRSSVKYDGNGNRIYQFSTENGVIYDTTLISGDRYFAVPEQSLGYFYKDAVTGQMRQCSEEDIKNGIVQNAKLYCKYPLHTVSGEEFVRHQQSNTNPTVLAGAIKYREMAMARKMQSSFGTFLQQNGIWLVALLVVAWIIVNYMNNNSRANDLQNMLLAAKDQLTQCVQNGGHVYDPVANSQIPNITNGGAFVDTNIPANPPPG